MAGLTLAYWLDRHGFTVTVVERDETLRMGGQAIDVRGAAVQVLDRMGILESVAALRTATRGMSVVDGDGHELMRDTTSTLSGGVIDSPDIEVLRDDLVHVLHAESDGARYFFDDTITGLTDHGDSVSVSFSRHGTEAFDLVIGADGLHSAVRRLAFGTEPTFTRRLGTFLAICTAPNLLDLYYWQVWYRDEARDTIAGLLSVRGNSEARALLGFTDPTLTVDYRDTEAQLTVLDQRFGSQGWVVPEILAAMRSAPDFYFDEATQIRMERWSSGRVGLVGDAAYCCSPVGGQGTSVALIGAYILAGELAAASTEGHVDHRRGFAEFEQRLRPHVLDCQSLAFDAATTRRPAPQEGFDTIINSLALTDYS